MVSKAKPNSSGAWLQMMLLVGDKLHYRGKALTNRETGGTSRASELSRRSRRQGQTVGPVNNINISVIVMCNKYTVVLK